MIEQMDDHVSLDDEQQESIKNAMRQCWFELNRVLVSKNPDEPQDDCAVPLAPEFAIKGESVAHAPLDGSNFSIGGRKR